jgi:hypothetical protein
MAGHLICVHKNIDSLLFAFFSHNRNQMKHKQPSDNQIKWLSAKNKQTSYTQNWP